MIFAHADHGHDLAVPVRRCRSEWVGVARSDGASRLVSIARIAAGTRLFRIEGEQTQRPTRYSVQIDEDLHIDVGDGHSNEEILDRYYWRFLNHSCVPNTRICGREVIASHEIEPWADVTFNYNTTEYDMAEPFACHCGNPLCLGTIKGFKHLTPEERERLRPLLAPHLSRNDSVQVERLDLKPLNVRGTGPKRVEVNSLHLSVVSFSEQKRGSTAWTRLRKSEAIT
ncbi:MAG: SET domain-containing protein-lysine N-methyltransferase [Opitutus sp.]|nr:SET domain-containing protein-lysine N-methyltransferase [Opitutus sp.]